MQRGQCVEPSCSRRAVRGTPYCRSHGRKELRKTEQVLAETVREGLYLRSPDHPSHGPWARVVASTLKDIAAEEELPELEAHVETLSKLLAGSQDLNPIDALARSGPWGEIKGSLSTIRGKLKEHRVTFAALVGSEGSRLEADPRLRSLLHRLELYATCFATLQVRKGQELLESYEILRRTLDQRDDAGNQREARDHAPPLGTSDAVRAAADFVRRYHAGERRSLLDFASGHEGSLLAGELMIAELAWDMVRDEGGDDFVGECFDDLVAGAVVKRGMRTAVQALADRLALPFRERWVGADEPEPSRDDVRDTNFAFAVVIEAGVSRLEGDDPDRWPWLFDQVVQVVLSDVET